MGQVITNTQLPGGDNPAIVPLGEKHETFCVAYVELGNASAAYRRVYDPENRQPAQQVWSNAARLMASPDVAMRVRQMRDAAAAATLVRAVDLIRDWYDIATADPNELVSVVIESCRSCHGVNFAFQWIDEAEYGRAYEAYTLQMERWSQLDAKTRLRSLEPVAPDLSGGFGFDPKRPPALNCPHCFGKGTQDVTLHDTTKLSPAARKLYRGAKKDRFGAIEVLMHDQEQARDKLARMLGAYKDGVGVPPVQLPDQKAPIDAAATDEQAARSYLQMVGR